MRRNRVNHFFLISVALGLLLLGYFFGNRYQYAELRNLPVELLEEPVSVEAALLPADLRQQAGQGAWLMVLPGTAIKACDALLEHYLEAYNRLAAHAELQARLHLALLDDSGAPASILWQHIEWAQVYPVSSDARQQLFAALQLSPVGNRWCQDVQATTALIGPDLRHYARLPLDQPKQIAHNLKLLLAALDSEVLPSR